ncbi:hypothetical protein [Microbacterium sp. NPDC091662]|uniref:hypothetical protein n=1 Tax=Microbacterium sp. NPDC091662 TaxID=3364211 RepID=UPI0037F1A4DD
MAEIDRPFSSFVKQYRPLQAVIDGYVEPLGTRLRAARSLADLESVEREAETVLASTNPPKLALGPRRAGSVREAEWAPRADGVKVRVTRHHVAVKIIGDFLLCTAWPHASDDLQPADHESWPESELEVVDDRLNVWSLGVVNESADRVEWALYTFLDLSVDDEARVANGEIDLTAIIDERVGRLTPIIERINRDLAEYFTTTLPTALRAALASKRQELTNRASVTESLRFPDEWVVDPIRLEDPSVSAAADAAAADGSGDTPIQGPTAAEAAGEQNPLAITQIPRLEPTSFERLQTTIRLWADSIERHPGGFRALSEDQISDLLCATLNATLAGTNREVFSRSGKTDIFVQADVWGEGHGPAKIFVAESKKAVSHPVVRSAVEDQLFRYVTTSDLSAVLLLLFPQKNFLSVRDDYLETLRAISGFVGERESTVDLWPIFDYNLDGRILSVCVAMVHL